MPPAARRILAELCQLLDQLQPARLAIDRQTVKFENGETWIRLVHESDRLADLDIAVGERTTHIYGLSGHDEDYATVNESDDIWVTDTISTLTGLLQGHYRVESSRFRGRSYQTLVTDRVGDARNTTSTDSILGWLPVPRRALTSTSWEVDYGCQGNAPSPQTPSPPVS